MAKNSSRGPRVIIRMSSTESPYRFSTKKNKCHHLQRLELRRYNPVPRRHLLFKESKQTPGVRTTEEIAIPRKCDITGKRPLVGSNVSDAHDKTGKRQWPNLKTKRIWVPELRKSARIKVSTSAWRSINKVGLTAFLRKNGLTLSDLA